MSVRTKNSRRRQFELAAAVGAVALAGPWSAANALAADRYFVGADGSNWNSGAKWSATPGGSGGGGAPVAGDNAYLWGGAGSLVNFNGDYSSGGLMLLNIGGAGSQAMTLTQSSNTMAVSGDLNLGRDAGTSGTYSLGGGTVNVVLTTYVGNDGTGLVNQTGGQVNTSLLQLGYGFSSSGSYALSSGTLNMSGSSVYLTIAQAGTGTFTQSGGVNTMSGSVVAALQVGSGMTSRGSYVLSGGTFTNNGSVSVGIQGIGTFQQSGGTHSASALLLGSAASGIGTYTLSNVASSLSITNEYIGATGTGIFNQSAGTHSSSASVYVSNNAGSRGTYNLSGGTHTIGGALNIGGQGAATTGMMNLSGTGNLSVSGTESIASTTGNATFTQSGGVHSAASLQMGFALGTSGVYNLSGGPLTVSGVENLGSAGSSLFIQTGGSHTAGRLNLTAGSGATSVYDLRAGSLTTSGGAPADLSVAGQFIQSGGTVNVGGTLTLTAAGGGVASYSLGGTGSSLTAAVENIGHTGFGTFTQSGGTNNAGFVNVGSSTQGNGTYNMRGGTLTISGAQPYLFVGDANNGTFNQTGGSVTAALLMVGRTASANGNYLLTGGTLSAGTQLIGGFNVGLLTQTGGSNTGSTSVAIGNGSHVGRYDLQGGTLSTPLLESRATFTQSGGNVTASGPLQIYDQGTYTIGGGSVSATNLYVGGTAGASNGTGVLTLSGGSITVTGTSNIWSTGTVNLNAGTLALQGSATISGSLSGSGGTLVIGGGGGAPSVTINGSASNTFSGFTALNSGTLSLNNSSGNALGGGVVTIGNGVNTPTLTLSANNQIDDNAVIVVNAGATFNVNNRTESIGELIVIGGTVSGNTGLTVNTAPIMMSDGQTISSVTTLVSGLGYATANGLSGATISGALTLVGGNHVFAIAENINAINDLNVTSGITGTGGLIKAGPGAMALAGGTTANTYSGLTSVSQGTLKLSKSSGTNAVAGNLLISSGGTVSLGNNQQIADAATVTIHSGGLLDLANRIENISVLAGDGNVSMGAGLLTVTGNSVFNGSISGTGTLTKSGAGTTLTLGGASTYTGALNISAGTVQAAHPSALGASTATTTVSQGATLDLNGQAISGALSLGSAGGSATVLNNAAGVASWGGGSVTLNGATTLSGSGEIAMLTAISGTPALTKTGMGTLRLAAANTFSGGLTATAGRVQINTNTSLGSGALTLNSATLEGALSSSTAVSNAIVLGAGGATITASTSVGLSLSGAISGSGALSIDTPYTVLLTGNAANTFSGVTTINRGTLVLQRPGVTNISGNIVIGDGVNVAELQLGQNFPLASTSGVTLNHNGTLNLNNFATNLAYLAGADGVITLGFAPLGFGTDNASSTFGGSIVGTGQYEKAGTGTQTLTGNNTDFTGTVRLTNGTLAVSSAANLGGNTLQFNGGTLQANGTFAISKAISTTVDNSGISVSAGNTVSFVTPSPGSSNITGSNSLIKSGAGTLALLSPSSSFTGALTISAGTVTTALGNALPAGGGGITLDGGTFAATSTFSLARLITLSSNGGTVDVTTFNTLSTGPILGTGPFTKTGAGTLSVAGTSNFSGPATLTAGTWSIAPGGGLPSGVALTVNAGATLNITNWSVAVIGSLSGSGSVVLGAASAASIGTNNTSTTYSGVISGSGGFIKSGSGTLTLAGVNTYSGATTISSGTLAAGVTNAVPAASFVSLPSAGAVFDLAGLNQSIVSLSGASGTSVVNSGASAATLTLNVPTAGEPNAQYNGSISGNLGLVVNAGYSTQALGGTNTYTGPTSVTGTGGLVITASNVLPANTDLSISSSANFNTNGNTQTVGSLSGSGQVLLSSGLLIVGGSNSTTFTGLIGDGGSVGRLTKSGSGTLTLTAVNAFSGLVTVSGGVLSVGANTNLGSGNAVSLNTGGTLRTTSSFTMSHPITLAGGALDVAAGTTLVTGTGLSGSGALIKTGAGSLTLAVTNSFTGPIDVQGGTVLVGLSAALTNGKALILSPGGTFDLGTTSTMGSPKQLASLSGTGGNLVLTPGGELFVGTDNSSTTFGGSVSGNFAEFRKLGTGTLTLTGHSSYTGATKIYAGKIKLGVDDALPTNSFIAGVFGAFLDMNGFNQTSVNPALIINSSPNLSTFTINSFTQGVAGFNGTVSGNVAIVFSHTRAGNAQVPSSQSGWSFNGADSFTGGLTVNSGRVVLSGAKTFSGGININGEGVVDANSDAALGATASNAIALNGGTLAFSGSFSTARNIAVAAAGATLEVATAAPSITYTGSVSGSSSLTKTGGGMLNVQSAQPFSGMVSSSGGVLNLSGAAGALSNASAVAARLNGTVTLDDSSGVNAAGRLNDNADVFLAGGLFSFVGANGVASSETARKLVVAGGPTYLATGGASTMQLTNGTGGTTALTFTSGLDLNSRFGATVNFAASALGTTNRVLLSGQANGFIGGWATVNGTDFAKYDATAGVTAFAGGDYTSSFTPGAHVRLVGPPASVSVGTASIATLTLDGSGGALTLSQTGGTALTLSEGGLLKVGASTATITGGDLTSGRADGEIDAFVNVGTLRVASRITNNGATPVSLVKSGTGLMILGDGSADTTPNTFTGTTYIHQGTLHLDKAMGTYAIQGPVVITGGLLQQLRDNQINPNAGITVSAGTLNFWSYAATLSSLVNLGGDISTGSSTVTVETVTLAGGTTTIDPNGTLLITGSGGGGGGGNAAGDGSGSGTAGGTPLIISGGTNLVKAGAVLDTTGILFSGTANPSLQMEAGAVNGLLRLGGDVSFTGTSGTAGITTTSVGAGQTAGSVDLKAGTRTFSVSSANATLQVTARLTNGGIVKSGLGTMKLASANTYAGGTNIQGGTLLVSDTAGLGASGSAVAFSGGTLALRSDAANVTFPYPVTAAPANSISIDIGSVAASSAGAFAMQSATLGIALNVTGTTGGSLSFTGATLQNTNPIGANNDTAIHNDVDLAVNGIINQSGSNGDILKDGLGQLTLGGAGANTFTGTMKVAGGTLLMSKTGGALAVPQDLLVLGGGTARLGASNQIAPASHVTLNAGAGAALLDLGNFTNTLAGGLSFVAGGTLSTGAAGSATLGSNVDFTGAAGTAVINGNLNLGAAGRTFTLARGSATSDLQIDAVVSGGPGAGAAITKDGPGVLLLNGVNTFGGAGRTVNVLAGTLAVSSDATLGNAANSIVLSNGVSGAQLRATATFTSNRPVALASGGGAIDVTSANTLTLGGAVTGTSGLTKNGAGLLVLNGPNSFSGGVTITGGSISVLNDSNLGDPSNTITLAGGTLLASGGVTLNRTLIFALAGGTFDAATLSDVVTLPSTATVGGAGGLTKTGAGILNINANQNWTAGALLNATGGTVNVNTAAGAGVLSLRVAGGALTNLNIVSQSLAGLTLDSGGVLINSGGAVTAGGAWLVSGTGGQINAAQPTTINGTAATSWTGTFTKTGGSSLDFNRSGGAVAVTSGAVVTISQGTLNAGGSVDPFTDSGVPTRHVAIANNASFGVTGGTKGVASLSGSGATTVAAGATLNVGSSPGAIAQATLLVNGALASNGGSGSVYGPITLSGTGPVALSIGATGAALVGDVTFTGLEAGGTIAAGGSLVTNSLHGGSLTTAGNVTVRANGTPAGASVVTTLAITGAGHVDIKDNELLVQSGATPTSVRGLLAAGSILTSSSGGGVGYTDGAPGQVRLKFTLLGDTNLDGKVDVSDLGILASSYGVASGALWINGDSTYNGGVDVADLGNLASYYGATLGGGGAFDATNATEATTPMLATAAAEVALGTSAAVPEPAMLPLAALGIAALATRRRRRTALA